MSMLPCRIRNRQNLLSSIYHNTPLFRSLITTLDDGLNRHNPCPCISCQTQAKRSSSTKLDSPSPKRARRRSSSSPPSPTTTPPILDYCHWCSFPDHYARLTCKECGKRKFQPPMVQHFRVNRPPSVNRFIPVLTPNHSTTISPPPAPTAHRVEPPDSLQEPYTPLTEDDTHLSTSCDFSYSPNLPSHQPLPHPVHISLPENPYEPPVQSVHFQYHSPRSTVPDPNELTDYESVCTPESPSMASKSINHLPKHEYHVHHDHHSTHATDNEIIVDSLMEDVSSEACDDENVLSVVDNPRFSLVTSELSDVTGKSVVELGGVVDNEHSGNKSLPDQNEADMFLNEIILSDKQKDSNVCNDISDLPLNFLEGMFTSINEQDDS